MGHTLHCVLGLFSLNMLLYCGHAQDFMLTIEPNWSTLFTGESVMLICDPREGEDTDWYYAFLKDGHELNPFQTNKNCTLQSVVRGHSGEYQCFVRHKHGSYSPRESNKVSFTVSDSDVILETPASTVYEGESVTVRCRHRTQIKDKHVSFYKDGSLIEMDRNQQTWIASKNTVETTVKLSSGSSYKCKFDEDESEPVKLKAGSNRPKARLGKDYTASPAGGSVTLTCSVYPTSSGWKYFWYRGEKTSEPLTTQDAVFPSNAKITVSQGGLYWCRGGRGEPLYYTEYSDSIVTNRAVVTLQPSWPEIYFGEKIALRCEIEDGGDTEWEYEWKTPRLNTTKYKYEIRYAQPSDSGDYRCMGRMKSGPKSSTERSDAFRLTVSLNQPKAVLTVSPSWLSPGDSVTLNCEVQHPSAGWRFFWYKAVPKLSDNYYTYELLPDSSNGTELDSFIVHEQKHTEAYLCRAGRGDSVYYTQYSELTFVWSGEFHSAASLTVSPDRVQHFFTESLTLSCEGNSSSWRVTWFSKNSELSYCSSWGRKTGSICRTYKSQNIDGVYWCESETGQFSNAVNISGQPREIILVSPVHPVAEGASVTLGCKLRSQNVLSHVDFYKNGKLIQNDTRSELIIPAVSKSDEGLYKCKRKDSKGKSWSSAESWMLVKSKSRPQSALFPVLWIVGLVCGVLLIILLMLCLCCYTKSKDSCFKRSQTTNQGSATDHTVNQDNTQCREYASLLHGDISLYERIRGPVEAEDGTSNEQRERAFYSNVTMGSEAGPCCSSSQPESTDRVVSQDGDYSTLLHGDMSLYETLKGHEKEEGAKHGRRKKPEESAVYSNARIVQLQTESNK